jgi:hypothetical protein
MKTPLTELIEFMEQNQYFIGNDLYAKQKKLLEKEKQMVVDAVNSNKGINGWKDGEEYFNETF